MAKDKVTEILSSSLTENEKVSALMEKTIIVPPWEGDHGLRAQYDPKQHPVMDTSVYRDIISDGRVEKVTRITCDLQRLAAKRMTELVCGIPVKRIYKPENDRQKEVADVMEAIFDRNRIDAVNNERCNMLFAGCEVMTLWYAVEQPNTYYGLKSPIKVRCRNFSPMLGDSLYPFFDEYGDMLAMSVGYTRQVGDKKISYFDAYTLDRHVKWSNESGEWKVVEDESHTVGKIPCIYVYRPTPIWEGTSNTVYEIEWALSRNGNYLRQNSKPLFVLFADEEVPFGKEKSQDEEFRSVLRYPKGSSAQYITWQQAVENLKYYVDQLRSLFFTQLQLPDWSYEKMSQVALSGESRKQMFIDAQLKVKDESGRLIEFFDRELNVVKAFIKPILGEEYEKEIDSLKIDTEITPFTIEDEKDRITNLMTANGGEAIASQRETIERLGWSQDPDKTISEINAQKMRDAFEPTA